MSQPKPSEVAWILGDRFTLNAVRATIELGQEMCTNAGCPCGGYELASDAAIAIDSAIADAVRKEAEECAGIVARNAICRGSLREALAAIRARHTPNSKEQPR